MIRRFRAKRKDRNHDEVAAWLVSDGCTVEHTYDVGRGFPDLVVRTPRGTVFLVEVKAPGLDGDLTPDEVSMAARWGTSYRVVSSELQAAALAAS